MSTEQLDPEKIIVDPKRFRQSFINMDSLKSSIKEKGIIQPLLIDADNNLLAGERRLRVALEIKMKTIPVHRIDADLLKAKEVEFIENDEREDFTWQERALAIKEIHELRLAVFGQKASSGSIGHSLSQLATELKKSKATLSTDLNLADAIIEDPELAKAKSRSDAIKLMLDKREDLLKTELLKRANKELDITGTTMRQKVFNADCIEWMSNAEPKQFDIVLTDPPYGIDIGESMGENVNFDDSVKHFRTLILKAMHGIDKVTKPNAHLYMFHSPDGWNAVKEALSAHNWSFDPKPIIWVRNIGISGNILGGRVRNADRRFAMSYEMITFAVKGNKALQRQGLPNVILHAGTKDKMHPTEKPWNLLKEILSWSLLPGDKVFDPFAGSCSTLKAASWHSLDAVGIELNEAFYAAGLNRVIRFNTKPGDRDKLPKEIQDAE